MSDFEPAEPDTVTLLAESECLRRLTETPSDWRSDEAVLVTLDTAQALTQQPGRWGVSTLVNGLNCREIPD